MPIQHHPTLAATKEKITALKAKYDLQPHPEGGFYQQVYKSTDIIKPPDRFHAEERSCATSIYYLLAFNNFSAWHRIKADETWHHYDGGDLLIYILEKDGKLKTITLGKNNPAAVFQYTILAEQWFAAELKNKEDYVLVGCTVAPGFEYEDFEIADNSLTAQYPQHKAIIEKLLPRSKDNG